MEWKTFALCGGSSGDGVRFAEDGGILPLKLSVEASIEENEKTKAGAVKCGTSTSPRVRCHSGWVVKPVSGIGEGFAERREQIISRIEIFVEAEVVLLRQYR